MVNFLTVLLQNAPSLIPKPLLSVYDIPVAQGSTW